MAITIKSYNQILGDMIRKVIANTPLNDINTGSVLLTLLEAAASNDFENNVAILNVLELLNVDALRNNDLDARAGDFGLTRNPALKASGFVTISDSTITKISTGLYPVKPAPIKGSTVLYVNDASTWANSGTLYIGRGTASFEGPIAYSSITNFTTYFAIQLSSSLQKDHLLSDSVIDAQGTTDRLVPAGTVVKIPANNQNPEVQYVTLRDVVLAAGEDSVSGVDVVAVNAGSLGNAGINTVTSFNSPPFSGATVTNTSAFTNGADIESDIALRERIKSYAQSLARGTKDAITVAVKGVSDPDEDKQVASAVITESVAITDPSILYIDDGSGFQPSFAGQSVDTLVDNATGKEEFLQLANYPLPRPQVVNTVVGPYNIEDGSFLRVVVDGVEETIFFNKSDFVNISAATAAEIIVIINANSTIFNARFTNDSNNILLYPIAHDAEIIQVSPIKATDVPGFYVNNILKFPTNEFSYISLYQNSNRLKEKAKAAVIETVPFGSWNINSSGDIIISVDGTPAQDRNFALSDFPGASSFASLTLDDWVTAFNAKFAGLTAVATPSQTMSISSNRVGNSSMVVVNGGSYLNKWFPNVSLSSTGQTAQFQLNRQTGNLRILNDIVAGDTISAGIVDAKGFVVSASTNSGTYNISADPSGRPAEMVVVVDSSFCDQKAVPLLIGTTITISDQGNSVMRVMSSANDTFAALEPGEFIYIVKRTSGWLSAGNTGLYKIVSKGRHTSAGVDSYVEVLNDSITPESANAVDSQDIKAFATDAYPQIWRGTYTSNPPAEPINGIVDSLNNDLMGVKAEIYRSNSIKITSTTENGGSIAIPVSIGNVLVLFAETAHAQDGNPSQIANRISDKTMFTYFRKSQPTSTNVWLGRYVYNDIKGLLSANAVPDSPPTFSGTYSELIQSTGVFNSSNVQLDDLVSFTRGNNKHHFRSIKALVATDQIGTQESTPRTEFDHIIGDETQILKSLEFSADDSVVFVMDNNPSIETVDVRMARTGIVNSGSASLSYLPTNTQFSANDFDNEPGIDFSNANVWSTVLNGTDFSDYSLWMRARNWYISGGVGSGLGAMIMRSAQFGPNGEKLRFSIRYPTGPVQTNAVTLTNTPSFNTYSYFFGSGTARAVSLSAGDSISVKGPYPDTSTNFPNGAASSGNYYDYTFSAGSFGTVQVGDVISILPLSGISNANRGQFSVQAKSGNTIRVFNPSASNTSPGSPEIVSVTTVADVQGTPTAYVVNAVADVSGSLNGTYFIIYDTAGSVAIWFDLNNSGTPEPPHGADRSIKVATVLTNDSDVTVATKIYNYLVLDSAFNAAAIGNQVTITNKQNGLLSNGSAGTSGFVVNTTPGTNNVSLDGKYFIIYDDNGSVAVWFDVGNHGTQEPFHGADRSIKVSGVNFGDSASTVASAIVAAVNLDTKFSASSLSNVATITNTFNGNVPSATPGTSGFSVGNTDGSFGTAELITNPALISLFPLINTTVNDIVSKINADDVMLAVAVGSGALTITKSTTEDQYSYSGNATALGYGHNPTDPDLRNYIAMYDGANWCKAFANTNPNFVLKKALILNGVSPTMYKMDTCPNSDTAQVGELFKLIPTTVKNVHHHLTQKALSQLPIIADVDITNSFRNVQIKSKQLGSAGAIEVIGGRGNTATEYIIGESEVSNDSSGNYLLVKVPAFPDTFNIGDTVLLQNDAGVRRLTKFNINDKIDVTNPSSGIIEYNYDPKITNISGSTAFTITDVSSVYSRPSGTVWRWTHDGSATLANVIPGDLIYAFGSLSGWDQGNKVRTAGDSAVAGLPIVEVNDTSNWVDVVNPYGVAMSSTTVGSGTVQICPSPVIKWNLAHSARAPIVTMSRTSGVVSVTLSAPHYMHTGSSVSIIDSQNVPDGVYSSVTVTSATQFTFALAGSDFTEGSIGASALSAGAGVTRYRLEKLGFNNMMRLSRHDGDSPRFLDCGVAVDDYMVISGNTFKSNNNGTFRVLSVDNSSIIFANSQGSEELNTIRPFNNQGLEPTWTANLNVVTGSAGTFKNLVVGDWVKKPEDSDDVYVQILSMNNSPALATQIILGSNYKGSSAIAAGIAYDEQNDYDKGVYLSSVEDIAFYEGDSAFAGDALTVQNIVDPNWFSVQNIGEFTISAVGTNPTTYKPFIRVSNSAGIAETNRLLSVNVGGFFVTESLTNKFYTYREIANVSIDDLNNQRRSLYIAPSDRSYKFSDSNRTSVTHTGKLGYSTDVTTGIDGYLYYTGLLRRVQRIVDGFEPDPNNFPGRRAVGGRIETLPPLPKRISLSVSIITAEGVNLGDISNNIKSTIITYVENLGVGEPVVLSEIISLIQPIKGVSAVTFTTPAPSTPQINVAQNEKAIITPDDIGIA